MSNTELLVRLRDLHEELSSINDDLKSADRVEEETIDALGQLVTDVNDLVDSANQEDLPDEPQLQPSEVLDRIERFESEHPRVTLFLSQVTDVLAMIGF